MRDTVVVYINQGIKSGFVLISPEERFPKGGDGDIQLRTDIEMTQSPLSFIIGNGAKTCFWGL